MKRISPSEYEAKIQGATVLSRDARGDKVLQISAGRIVKLFRRKRLWSSALWSPYAKRFEQAALKLKQLSIPTVEVLETFRIRGMGRDAVVYAPLEGTSLRNMLADGEKRNELIEAFAAFLARLHEEGVYFRAIDLENVLVVPGGEFGLIDVSEARFLPEALGTELRARNFKPLVRYAVDEEALRDFGVARFVECYLDHAGIQDDARRDLLAALREEHDVYKEELE